MVTYEEYNETRYPDFCPGFGYILSHDVVRAFVVLLSESLLYVHLLFFVVLQTGRCLRWYAGE